MFTTLISWFAVFILSISYWFQIYKIHVHKEVRDISLPFTILLTLGTAILGFTAYQEHSIIFLTKQVLTTIPLTVMLFQIFYHRGERWKEDNEQSCKNCQEELEVYWTYCPFCGKQNK